jgi:hypothetical protein
VWGSSSVPVEGADCGVAGGVVTTVTRLHLLLGRLAVGGKGGCCGNTSCWSDWEGGWRTRKLMRKGAAVEFCVQAEFLEMPPPDCGHQVPEGGHTSEIRLYNRAVGASR